jgi:hypothetical protein
MFDAIEGGHTPRETFYDGYVVNAIVDAAYGSIQTKRWESIGLPIWRGRTGVESVSMFREHDQEHLLIKEEQLPNGQTKLILKHKQTGVISQQTVQHTKRGNS